MLIYLLGSLISFLGIINLFRWFDQIEPGDLDGDSWFIVFLFFITSWVGVVLEILIVISEILAAISKSKRLNRRYVDWIFKRVF